VLWFDRPLLLRARFWARIWSPGNLNTDFYDLAAIRGLPASAPTIVAAKAIHAVNAADLVHLAQPVPDTTGLMGWMRRRWPVHLGES
jgi:hypothetical protein